MIRVLWLLVFVSLPFACCGRRAEPPMSATLILRNAKVWTIDDSRPQSQAVAVYEDRIVRVGSDAEMAGLGGDETRVIDLGGKLVVPGFNDDHVHFIQGGMNLLSVQLRDARSPEELARKLGDYAGTTPKGEWILGGAWDHESWSPAHLPTHRLVDPATPDNPVFVNRLDGHMALANSAALKQAGVTRGTRDPEGGAIVRDATGEPTGVLKDAAMDLVSRVIPPPSPERLRKAALAGLAEARRVGVTSVQDMTSPEEFSVYQQLLESGELTARINCRFQLPEYRRLSSTGIRSSYGNEWLRLGALKGMADGSLGSTTALFFDPYDDAPGTRGLPGPMMFPPGNMNRLVAEADAARLQVTIHAIGDRANNEILDIFEEVARKNPPWDRRFRIEHAQHLSPADIPRFGGMGVIPSMQPYHAIDDGRWAAKRIGDERCKTTYAFRSLLDAGARLAFGSDWPVAPLNPILGIYAAVTRRTLDGKNPGGWYPEQKISLAEAVKAYTLTSAYATFEENTKGSIAPGKLADLVVLSRDIFTIPPEGIDRTEVLYTIVNGKVVYERGK